ncbi:T9SS type A sorting domain-containing protein [Taibaiella chishuiensis]|uniref:Putative secreted protein (Por secretion system target) n=1 Tax=Taibaiella chishuiensis TaxID=1434707 RepID=A0A2P8DB00_9BACT|nr:T9SS type A sorting domain-containing protein [Taibaiella chishuiensis]PSK94400.1 putative secreted protein (Por secretion system target) [Taibaiella chishuiensis]
MDIKKLILPLVCSVFSVAGAFAQQRSCNMAVTLISPSEGAVIAAFAQFDVTVNIKNNGTADLVVGDTLWYNTPLMFDFNRQPFVLTEGIAAGQARTIKLATITNVDGSSTDQEQEFCVRVESNPTGNGAYIDPDFADNRDCNTIIQKATPTAINDVDKHGRMKLQLSPNPTPAMVKMTFSTERATEVNLSVKDMTGREVMTRNMGKVSQGAAELHADVSGLAPGIYMLELQGGGQSAIGKLVKQ